MSSTERTTPTYSPFFTYTKLRKTGKRRARTQAAPLCVYMHVFALCTRRTANPRRDPLHSRLVRSFPNEPTKSADDRRRCLEKLEDLLGYRNPARPHPIARSGFQVTRGSHRYYTNEEKVRQQKPRVETNERKGLEENELVACARACSVPVF